MKNYYCIEKDCNNKVSGKNRRCKSCENKRRYKAGVYLNRKIKKRAKYYCKDCGKGISYHSGRKGQGRCRHCAHQGELQSNYIDGRTLIKYYCPDCLKKGIETEIGYQAKRCGSCASKIRFKKLWRNEEYRNKIVKAILKGLKLSPNKPEKLLNKLLQEILFNEYQFVGDGKVVFGGFCPDFINCNGQKKIIELYGDYWHRLPKIVKKDKGRLITYNRLGYFTLIIWEHELKDLNKLKTKILEFNARKTEKTEAII